MINPSYWVANFLEKMPRINKKRPTSNKKKKKKSATKISQQQEQQHQITDVHQLLSQADTAYETSNVESALQLYTYTQSILNQTIIQKEQSNNSNKQELISDILTLSKVSCKIGEIKASFHDPNDRGYNDFQNGLQLLSNENEFKYLSSTLLTTATTNENCNDMSLVHDLMLQAQWKEVRSNLYLYLGQLSSQNDALNNFNNAVIDLKNCLEILERIHSIVTTTGRSPTCSPQQPQQLPSSNDDTNNNESNIDQNNIEITIIETSKQLCGAYCSIAELYLTDLCYEPNAEKECENALTLALELDKKQQLQVQSIHDNNKDSQDDNTVLIVLPDAAQAMANLRLCQNRFLEAIPFILDAYSRMKVGCEAMADLVGLGRESSGEVLNQVITENSKDAVAKELGEDALKAANKLPGFEFRCQTAKILLECAANLEQSKSGENEIDQGQSIDFKKREEQRLYCIEAAIQTLGSLMAENDEVIETWYLLGCAFQSKSSDNFDVAKHYFESTLEMLMKTKDEIEQSSDMHIIANDEFNPLTDIMEKIEDVKKKMKEVDQNIIGDKMDED